MYGTSGTVYSGGRIVAEITSWFYNSSTTRSLNRGMIQLSLESDSCYLYNTHDVMVELLEKSTNIVYEGNIIVTSLRSRAGSTNKNYARLEGQVNLKEHIE